ncbi:putative transporter svop-1 isoform X3 [Choristoneura fumiferana]
MFSVGIVSTASQCDLELDVGKKGLISSIPILGVVVSAHFWGFVADTRGRRFALIISTTGTCVAGIIATFSNNWILLAVIKFIGAAFASGTNALVFTFLGEATIASKRQTYLMYASAGVLSFQAFNAALAYPILNLTFDYYMPLLGFSFRPWRLFLLVIGLISGLNVLLIVFFTYESPKFCFAIGEHKRGLKIMQKIYKVNTGNAFEDYPVKHVVLNADDYKTKNGTFLRSVWDQTVPLFSKKYIKNTVLIFLCGLPAYCVSPPFSIWLPFIFNAYSTTSNPDLQFCETFQKNFTQSANRTMIPVCDDSVADITLVALAIFAVYLTLCSLSTVLIIKFIGKKWTFVLNHLFSCIMCVIINRVPILFGFVAMVGMTANVACMGIVTTYAIELFPTYMRAMAVCLCILSGRSVSIVFYNVIGAQLENNCDNFIVIIAGLILFGGIVGLFLPSDRVLIKADDIEKPSENCESTKNPTST